MSRSPDATSRPSSGVPGIAEYLETQTGPEALERGDYGALRTAECEAIIVVETVSGRVEAVCNECGQPVDLASAPAPGE